MGILPLTFAGSKIRTSVPAELPAPSVCWPGLPDFCSFLGPLLGSSTHFISWPHWWQWSSVLHMHAAGLWMFVINVFLIPISFLENCCWNKIAAVFQSGAFIQFLVSVSLSSSSFLSSLAWLFLRFCSLYIMASAFPPLLESCTWCYVLITSGFLSALSVFRWKRKIWVK